MAVASNERPGKVFVVDLGSAEINDLGTGHSRRRGAVSAVSGRAGLLVRRGDRFERAAGHGGHGDVARSATIFVVDLGP